MMGSHYMRFGHALLIAFAAGLVFASSAVRAQETPDRLSPDWWACVEAAEQVQDLIGAPDHLLTAIALNETGRRAPNGQAAPWPWTINVGGQGFEFATKEQAVFAARQLINAGTRSFDVGCMQVNVFFHPRAFTSIEEAFDPLANMLYAADYLNRLEESAGSWTRAVELYHSYTEEFNQIYGARFRTHWDITRARAADGDALVTSRPLDRPLRVPAEIELLGDDDQNPAVLLEEREARYGTGLRDVASTGRTPMVAALLASFGDEAAVAALGAAPRLDLRDAAIVRRVSNTPVDEATS